MDDQQAKTLLKLLERVAESLEASSGTGAVKPPPDWTAAKAWLWLAPARTLKPVTDTGALPADILIGIDAQKETLTENTFAFANGFAANNALLWGARGMGKSSLVKAVHAELAKTAPLDLIEIYRDDIATLPLLLDLLRGQPDRRFILFCDDLSFDENDSGYKSLKAVLEGGIEARPENVLFYATSNRRHLIPRKMIENERDTAIHANESVEEKVSLSDRFGLWLGFYACDQAEYLSMVAAYGERYGLAVDDQGAIEWFRTRGNRSGRVAWQYIQHIAGQQEKKIA